MGGVNGRLWDAVQANNPIGIDKAIRAGADPNVTTQFMRNRGKTDARQSSNLVYEIEEWTPLHFACDRGFSQVVYVLLRNKADITKRIQTVWATTSESVLTYEQLPIHLACKGGHYDVVQVLINHSLNKCGINSRDFVNSEVHELGITDSPLSNRNGISGNDLLLNERTAKRTNSSSSHHRKFALPSLCGYTPLYYAVAGEYLQIVYYLLENGADSYAICATPVYTASEGWHGKSSSAQTPVGLALKSGHDELANELVSRHHISDEGLLQLAMRGHLNTVQYIAEHDPEGGGALVRFTAQDALQRKQELAFICQHFSRTSNVDVHSMLYESCRTGNTAIIQYILQFASIDEITISSVHPCCHLRPSLECKTINLVHNVTPVHAAAVNNQTDAIALVLLERRGTVFFNVDTPSDFNTTALHVACIMGHIDAALLLLSMGASISSKTYIDFDNEEQIDANRSNCDMPVLPMEIRDEVPALGSVQESVAMLSSWGKGQLEGVSEAIQRTLALRKTNSSDSIGGSNTPKTVSDDNMDEECISDVRNITSLPISSRSESEWLSDIDEGATNPQIQREYKAPQTIYRTAIELARDFGHEKLVNRLENYRHVDPHQTGKETIPIEVAAPSNTVNQTSLTLSDRLSRLLVQLDLIHLEGVFVAENITDVDTLTLLKREDLKDLGIKIGDCRKLMTYIEEL
eukprot:CFRG4947T1